MKWDLVETRPLFAMLGDPRPGHGLLGVSDPDVHHLDGGWSMFLGAFTTGFAVRIVEARLPIGAPITDDRWAFVTGERGRATPIGAPTHRNAWDRAGMHTPSYVAGRIGDRQVERIYYAGRRSQKITGPESRYSIGYVERVEGVWRRGTSPVLTGDDTRPSVLEPFVICQDGVWRMWFLSAIGEVGRNEQPDYELRYAESEDGEHWSRPERFADADEGFFDNTVIRGGDGWTMLLARGTNLYGTAPYPSQGLWISEGAVDPRGRAHWPGPERMLDTGREAEPWYAAGVCGPAAVADGDDLLHVFATGTHSPVGWWRASLGRLRRRRSLPPPAPYFLTTGRFTFRRNRAEPPVETPEGGGANAS